MDGVPYQQPLAVPEPQYVPWGVLLVRPIGHPPRPVPPRAADQRSRAYPTLLRVLRWSRYSHRGGAQTPEVGSFACVSCEPLSSRPLLSLCALWWWVSRLSWLGWGGGGGGADVAEEKQRSSDEEKTEEMQSRGDQDEAVHKQPRADEDKECAGRDRPGHNKKERPKRNDHKRRREETRRSRLEHPGRKEQQGPPAPGLEHRRTRGGQTPRTGSSGVGQAAGTAAPRTGASGDQRRWTPPGPQHPGQNKQQAPWGATEVATRTRPWR